MCCLPLLLTGLVALPGLAEPASPPAPAAPKDRGKLYFQASTGRMQADEDQLGSASGLALAAGIGYGVRHRLALEIELDAYGLDYDVPAGTQPVLFGSVDGLDVSATSVTFLVKGRFPFGRFRPYLGAGPGMTSAKAELNGSLVGIPGTFADESDVTMSLQALAGFDIRLTRRSHIGLEYRGLDVEASFGDLSGGSVPIGGQSLRFTYLYQFN